MSEETQSENCQGLEAEMPQADVVKPTRFAFSRVNVFFILFVILPCAGLFFFSFKNTLNWRFSWDLPLMLYTGYLMEQFSYIPYRDFFDMNMPGAHLTYMFIVKTFGFSDLGIRWADLSYILAIMGATMLLTRNMGLRVLLLAPFIFAFWYIRQGPTMTLQREILALPLIILGAGIPVSCPKIPLFARAILAGFLFGLAATIKPHLAIGLPVVVLYLASENWNFGLGWKRYIRNVVSYAFCAGCGLIVPLAAVAAYLLYNGALGAWLEMMFNYLPLYSSITGSMSVLNPGQRGAYLFRNIVSMQYTFPLLPAGVLGLLYGMANPAYSVRVRKQILMLMGLGISYWIYPIISGQFWVYHYYPFNFFMCVGMALSLGPWNSWRKSLLKLVPLMVVVMACIYLFRPQAGLAPLFKPANAFPTGGRPATIAAYLRTHLKPGDKVQPLDIASGGVVHAMLMTQSQIATPFIYWFHFYHHISNPYILQLRQQFMESLNATPPRFIIKSKMRPRVITGYDTGPFPALDAFLKAHYKPVQDRWDFVILEYTDNPQTQALPKVVPKAATKVAPKLMPKALPAPTEEAPAIKKVPIQSERATSGAIQ